MLELKAQNYNSKLKADLRVRAYYLSLRIIKLVQQFPSSKLYLIFTDQLVRSATSIGANLVEAKASSSKRDFIKFYEIALKSANETTYWLGLLRDSKLCSEENIKPVLTETQEVSRMLGASLLTMKNKR